MPKEKAPVEYVVFPIWPPGRYVASGASLAVSVTPSVSEDVRIARHIQIWSTLLFESGRTPGATDIPTKLIRRLARQF